MSRLRIIPFLIAAGMIIYGMAAVKHIQEVVRTTIM